MWFVVFLPYRSAVRIHTRRTPARPGDGERTRPCERGGPAVSDGQGEAARPGRGAPPSELVTPLPLPEPETRVVGRWRALPLRADEPGRGRMGAFAWSRHCSALVPMRSSAVCGSVRAVQHCSACLVRLVARRSFVILCGNALPPCPSCASSSACRVAAPREPRVSVRSISLSFRTGSLF